MNEFIVWDEVGKLFFTNEETTIQAGKIVSLYDGGEWFSVESDSAELFPYIGLKDINDNKIYADSSIVEFEIEIYQGSLNKPLIKKVNGHFYFDIDWLAYMIKTDSGVFNIGKVLNNKLKIIDTIQENKLGLIK